MRDPSKNRPLRCAIYTRKSSEEGLDQDFNSLEAQREACEAYVRSQAHEGWKLLPDQFDDGGFSGGNMDRPGLTRLMEKVQRGEIDIIVIYKIDRLTRSLMDFAKLAEAFDKHEVSFVSVTQQFNTTTSMGRLMLNVLLSFAQFERELTGERIRDKFAASKRRGMWMGGPIPLGYDVKNRSLVINEAEAEAVRTIFRLYLEGGNVRLLKEAADSARLRTKSYVARSGRIIGGQSFSRGHLYKILSNPLYIGEVSHKGERHKGQHAPIIDKPTWDKVQSSLADNTQGTRTRANATEPSLLAGLLFDETGNKLVATHTVKDGKRYRYYSVPKSSGTQVPNLPAQEIESLVLDQLRALEKDPAARESLVPPVPAEELPQFLRAAATLRERLGSTSPTAVGEMVRTAVARIIVTSQKISVELRAAAIGLTDRAGVARLQIPHQPARRGNETRLIVRGQENAARTPDPVLVRAIANAHIWFEQLVSGEAKSFGHIARRYGVTDRYVKRIMELRFLAPSAVGRILRGEQRPEDTLTALTVYGRPPVIWA